MFESGGTAGRLAPERLAAALSPAPRRVLPADLRPRDDGLRLELAALSSAPPGPDLAARLVELGAALPDPGSQLRLLALWERYASWVAARQQEVLARVAGPPPRPAADGSSSDDWVREDVGCALRLSPSAAYRRITMARRLDGALRPARDALGRGDLTFLHALTLAEEVRDLPDPAAAAVTAQVLPGAGGTSLGAFRKAVTRAVAAADPTALETAQLRSRRDRRVERWRGPDGAAVLAATGPAVDAELIYTALTAGAHAARNAHRAGARHSAGAGAADGDPTGAGTAHPAGPPGLDALRYDTLLGWARAALAETTGGAGGHPGASGPDAGHPGATGPGAGHPGHDHPGHGRPATSTGPATGPAPGPRLDIGVLIDLPTLLGLAENPAELRGYGPIPAPLARQLAADGAWRRLVTHPVTGHLLDYGRRTYQPPAALADYITARDRTCRFPHCTQPASRCDHDHRQPWDTGGPTTAINIHSLCRRHHRLKTFTRWRYQRHPDGSITWTSPTGHATTNPPPTYRQPGPPVGPDTG